MEEVTPDVVIVCCGGGGLIAGIATAMKVNGNDNTRIYGVEPETGGHRVTHILFKLSFIVQFISALSLTA